MAEKEEIPTNNGAVLNILQIIIAVMSSAAEAKLGALFINAKNGRINAQTAQRISPPTSANPHPIR